MPTFNSNGNRASPCCEVTNLRGQKTVRADRRLRTGDETIRAHSTMLEKKQMRPGFTNNRVFRTDVFYPYGRHGWRAQRAKPFVALSSEHI